MSTTESARLASGEYWTSRAAAATVDITPRWPTPLGAGGTGNELFTGIDDRLEANLLVLEAESDSIVLITVDLLYVGARLLGIVRANVSDLVDPERVLIFASHTHNAPATDTDKPLLGDPDTDYIDHIGADISAKARQLLRRRGNEVVASTISTRAEHAINRRRRRLIQVTKSSIRFRATVLAENPRGPRQERITLVRLTPPGSTQPLALIWSYACHPVGYPRPGRVSAHYPGAVRASLRGHFRSARLPVLFLQGFSGNIRPRIGTEAAQNTSSLAKRVLRGPGTPSFHETGYQQWIGSLVAAVISALNQPGTPVLGPGTRIRTNFSDRNHFVTGGPSEAAVEFGSLSLGDDLEIVGAAAEVVVEFDHWLRARSAVPITIPAGCMGDVFGYAPTRPMLAQGGYEAGDYCPAFGCEAVSSDIESSLRWGLASVASQCGSLPSACELHSSKPSAQPRTVRPLNGEVGNLD